MHKKSKESKAVDLPVEVTSRLTNKDIHIVDRCILVERCHNETHCNLKQLLGISGVSGSTYYRCRKILRSGREDIIDRIKNGLLTIGAGEQELSKKKSDIVFETSELMIYVEEDKCFLKKKGKRKVLSLNKECASDLIQLIQDGFRPLKDGIYHPDGRNYGYIVLRGELNLVSAVSNRTQLYKPLRINRDEIAIRRKCKNSSPKVITDYSPQMWDFVSSDRVRWHTKARDKRLIAYVTGCRTAEYLYHIRMAEHLYGIPNGIVGFLDAMVRFRDEHISRGINVDHLDNDVDNNRLSNLFFMSKDENISKSFLMRQIQSPYFWHSKRHDDETIEVRAGYHKSPFSDCCMVAGVFTKKEYFDVLRDFVSAIKENGEMFEYFNMEVSE